MKKYQNIDVIAFLEEQMKANTVFYREDFEIDKRTLAKAAASDRPEDKTMLWFSRPNGTLCVKEHDAFIKDTAAHAHWRFYAEETQDHIVAFAVELTGKRDGVLMGNVFELDYRIHAAEVAACAVPLLEEEKTFADGFRDRFPINQGNRALYLAVDQHGMVKDTFAIPKDAELLSEVLQAQKGKRDTLRLAEYVAPLRSLSLQAQTAYNEVKHRYPDSIVCFAQHGHFEIYGEDAKKAAPILGSKLLMKELEGSGRVAVTGFREDQWIAYSKKLWSQGNDVLLTRTGTDGKQETVKDLRAADYIPLGAELQMSDRLCQVDAVDFNNGLVRLIDITDAQNTFSKFEPIPYVRSFVEETIHPLSKAEIDAVLKNDKSIGQKPQRSVLEKIKECSKAASERSSQATQKARKPKSKEMEM